MEEWQKMMSGVTMDPNDAAAFAAIDTLGAFDWLKLDAVLFVGSEFIPTTDDSWACVCCI